MNSPLQVPWRRPFQGSWEVWSPVVWTHPVVLFNKRYHHPILPLQRYWPWPPCDATWQVRQPHNIERLGYSGQISSTPDALPPRSLPTTSVTSTWAHFIVPSLCFLSVEGISMGLRSSSWYSFHSLTMCPVELRSSPPTLQTVFSDNCFPLLKCQMVSPSLYPVVQNIHKEIRWDDNKVDHQSVAWGLLEPCVLMETLGVCYGQAVTSRESNDKTPLMLK